MKSKKLYLTKKFIIIWIILLVVLITSILTTIVSYSKYKKGQDFAIKATLYATNKFDKYKNNRKELINKMHEDYNSYCHHSTTNTLGEFSSGYNKYCSLQNTTVMERDKALGDLLKTKGFDENEYGSYYLLHTSFLSYYIYKWINLLILYICIFIIILILNIRYAFSKNEEITVKKDIVRYKKGAKKSKEIMIKDIKKVKTTFLKGLFVYGNGITIKTPFLQNNNELKEKIRKSMPKKKKITIFKSNNTISKADELEKFKKLLDSGVITQEEFKEEKKKILSKDN